MTFIGHTYAGLGFPFNIDGTRMLSSGFDTKAYVWGFTNGTALTEYTEQTNLTTGNAFIHGGKQAATGSADGTVRIWDAETGETIKIIPVEGGGGSLKLTPDGRTLVAGTLLRKVIGWDIETWQETVNFQAHQGVISGGDFYANGTQLLTAGFEGTAKVWEFPSGEELATLFGHQGNVAEVTYGPEDKIAYT